MTAFRNPEHAFGVGNANANTCPLYSNIPCNGKANSLSTCPTGVCECNEDWAGYDCSIKVNKYFTDFYFNQNVPPGGVVSYWTTAREMMTHGFTDVFVSIPNLSIKPGGTLDFRYLSNRYPCNFFIIKYFFFTITKHLG